MTYYAVEPTDVPNVLGQLAVRDAQCEAGGRWYALIDTSMLPLNPHQRFDYHQNLYLGTKYDALSNAAPVLLDIGPTHDIDWPAVKRLAYRFSGFPALSFLNSDAAMAALLASWAGALDIESTDGEVYLLRFADTRCLPYLLDSVAQTRPGIFFRTFNCWLYIDRFGQPASVPLERVQEAEEAPVVGQAISDAGLDLLLKEGLPDALAEALDRHFPDLLSNKKKAEVFQSLQQIARLSEHHAIESFADQIALAVAELSSEKSIIDDMGFNKWISEASYSKGQLSQALNQYLE